MSSTRTIFWLLAFLGSGSLSLVKAATNFAGNETDRLALVSFKAHITRDPFRDLSLWNDSLDFCQWQGVTCGRRHARVISLTLQASGLVGSISPSLGNLSFLRELTLQNNSFQGEIPPELGGLFRLRVLRLSFNSLEGQIPANLSHCSNLVELSLASNKLGGNIPVELGHLSKLEQLSLQINSLTGEIPPSLGNISSLERILLGLNNLEGRIPDEIGQLGSLETLRIGGNKLSGMIPSSIYNISSITDFSVTQNQLHGSLPHDMGLTLPNLELLNFVSNQFSGVVPLTLSNASALKIFDISENNFTGKVSVDFGKLENLTFLNIAVNRLGRGGADDLNFIAPLTNCSKLRAFGIYENLFGGAFPISITNLSTQLTRLVMGRNQIHGSIPEGIGNLVNLNTLGMEINQLTGSIPYSIGKLQKLQAMSFSTNKLSGKIPSSLGNLTIITQMALNDNSLRGSIPTSLNGNFRFLNYLDLSRNNLSGTIPREVLSLPSLSVNLNLSYNSFNGSLPVEVGNLKNLVYLDVSENKISGEIPSSIGGCTVLEHLHMEGNLFQGPIPSTLTSLRGLQDLDLSRNNLSGQIPKYLGKMSLMNLNLSYNNFAGELPMEGVFRNTSAISVEGNSWLCGGISELKLPSCTMETSRKRRTSRLLITLLIPILCGLLGLTLLSSFLILYWLRKKRKKPSSPTSSLRSLLNVSYDKLLKGTDGFSSANLIGVGSFGSVYKGVLDQGGTVVAVKVLNLQHQGASKSFMAECEVLRNIRHRNLVKILTACSSADFRGNDFKALVYEFMPKGSLERWLHPIPEIEEPKKLNLVHRLNIAIDVASALEYLHHHCQKPIVHCDLKPSNVLLDNGMTAHLGDFGLARFLLQATGTIHPNQTSSVGVKGSIGYTAPEYGVGSEISTNGDVYSYGILLLEMFTRKRPTDEMFKDGLNLHTYVKMALPDQIMKVVDPILLSAQEEEEEEEVVPIEEIEILRSVKGDRVQECLILILRLGVACSMESPRQRMDIFRVANELQEIKKSILQIN